MPSTTPALFVPHGAPAAGRLEAPEVDGLRSCGLAPDAELAVPSSEHFDPLFFVPGSRTPRDRVSRLFTGFRFGTLSLRSFALCAA